MLHENISSVVALEELRNCLSLLLLWMLRPKLGLQDFSSHRLPVGKFPGSLR